MKKFLFISLFFVVGLISGCGERTVALQHVDTAMGTMFHQTIYVTDESSPITSEVIECAEELEQECLSWRLQTAELYAVNESAGAMEGVELSDRLYQLVQTCMEVSGQSEGAFDITIGEVVRLWDIDQWAAAENHAAFDIPEEVAIEDGLAKSGYEKLQLQEKQLYLPEGMQLDLGAVGKGIALDEIKALLQQHKEVTGAVISAGGSILTYGSKPDKSNWKVAIVDPLHTSESLGVLSLSGEWCISTSGDYERYVEVDGERYHHIIDPATGMPARSGVRSVTIVTQNGLYSDALSTACFVLGAEEGLKLAEKLGVEALFVKDDGTLVMTKGMEEIFQLY